MHPTPHHHPDPEDPRSERITVRGPAALAAALPYIIDAPLEGAMVLAAIHHDSTLGMTAVKELPPHPVGASREVLQHWAGDIGRIAAEGARLLDPCDAEYFAIVIYLPGSYGQPPFWFGPAVTRSGLLGNDRLLDVVAVFGDRWRSLSCRDEACCPASGSLILDNSDAALVAAELVAAGLSASGTARGHQAPQDPAKVAQVLALLEAMPYPGTVKARRRLLRRAWPLLGRALPDMQPAAVAALVMAADRPGVRDAILTRMARRAADPDYWERQLQVWHAVLSATPAAWSAGPACMVAVAAWALDDAIIADAAIEAALAIEPEHRMALLIGSLMGQQTPAATWFERMLAISEGDCLRFDRPPVADRPRALPGSAAAG